MNLLNKDELYLIATNLFSIKIKNSLSIDDILFFSNYEKVKEQNRMISYENVKNLLSFCLVNKRVYSVIWNRNDIWNYLFSLENYEKYNKYNISHNEISVSTPKRNYIYFHKFDILGEKLNLCSFEIDSIYEENELFLDHEDDYENKLYELDKYIGILTNLQILDLTDNRLTILPLEIGNLTNLKKLYLTTNMIKILPKEIGKLINLEKLDLQSNKLEKLPEEMKYLTNLKTLNLEYNDLTNVSQLVNLTNLKVLKLYGNPNLKVIPEQLKELTDANQLSYYLDV